MRKNISHPIFNGPANHDSSKPWLVVRNGAAASDPVEILIIGQIGKNWWDNSGVAEKEFRDVLNAIPTDREIIVGINSEGGEVKSGLGIYNALQSRKDKVTCRVDGYAVSIASVIALAGKRTISPKSSIWMIHEPWTYAQGNAEDMQRASEMLDQHAEMLVDIYSEHTGKTRDEIRAAMKKETWLRGTEALDYGLCDECPDCPDETMDEPKASFDLPWFKNAPDYVKNSAVRNGAESKPQPAAARGTKENYMDRNEIIAALKARGDVVDESHTTEQLKAQLIAPPKNKANPTSAAQPGANASDILDIRNQLDAMRKERDTERKSRITARVQELQPNRFPVAQVESWVKRAMADETVLDELAGLPLQAVGTDPLNASVELTGESLKDVEKHIVANSSELTSKFIGVNAGRSFGKQEVKDIADGAKRVARAIRKHRGMLMDVLNTNTISDNLKRNVILNGPVLQEFAIPLLSLQSFSTVFANVPLEGTDKVEVPYMGLQGQNESKSFSGTYTFTGNTSIGVREIVVGGDGDAASCGENATAGTVKDRLYQDVSFTSYEQNRQPFLNIDKLFGMKGAQLGVDIFSAIVRRCIVTGNNYAVALTRSAAAFTSDDLANLWETATGAKWPAMGRQVTLSHQYNTSLIKDPAFKAVYAAGKDEALRRAEIKQAYGFDDINIVPNLDTYMAANAAGWINHMSALLVATAVIAPTEEVRRLLTRFEIATEPQSGATFSYRRWGNAEGDATREIVECSIGAARGLESAMQIIKKA